MEENVNQIKSGITINVDASAKKPYMWICGKDYIWNSAKCSCESGKY